MGKYSSVFLSSMAVYVYTTLLPYIENVYVSSMGQGKVEANNTSRSMTIVWEFYRQRKGCRTPVLQR